MLTVNHLSVTTRQLVYEDISYSFSRRKLYGILAINGPGKNTLFRAMMKLISIANGTVEINGKDIQKFRRNVFYFESFEWD